MYGTPMIHVVSLARQAHNCVATYGAVPPLWVGGSANSLDYFDGVDAPAHAQNYP